MEFTLVNLLAVLLVAWLAGALTSRLGYPAILGELAAGILLGPACFNLLHDNPGLHVLAEVGVFLMMLYIGMEIDHRDLFGASWAGLLAAAGGFIVPGLLGYFTAIQFEGVDRNEALFLAIALGVTALVVNSRILVDMKLLGTRIGNVLVAGALIADTAAIVIFAGMLALMLQPEVHFTTLGGIILKAILFFGITTLLGLYAFPAVGRRLMQAGFTARTANFTLILLVALVFAALAEQAGLHSILGAFWAGLFLREEVLMRKLSQDISSIVHDLSVGFLAPIFFVTVGFHVTLSVFSEQLPLLIAIIVAATVGKVGGTILGYLPTGYGWREGLVVGAGMNGRGAVEIIFAGIGLRAGIIDQDIFSILVFMAFFTTATVPLLLKWGTNWLRQRGELVRSDDRRQGFVIVGAGPLARMLARELVAREPVRLIDTNAEDCALAQAEGFTVINGNALREDTFSLAQASRIRGIITLTPNVEVNRFAAQTARDVFGVPDIYQPVVLSRKNGQIRRRTPEDNPNALFGGDISISDWNRWIARGEVQRVRLAISSRTSAADLFAEVNHNGEGLPLVRLHDGLPSLIHRGTELEPGDEVIVLQHEVAGDMLEDRLTRVLRECPILDFQEALPLEDFLRTVAETMAVRVGRPSDELYRMLLERERESSTVILPTVAIPHVLIEGEHVFDMLVARCRHGVRFSDHGPAVQMVFVLIGTRDERNFHLRALSAIGQMFQDPAFEDRWQKMATPDDLRHLILSTRPRGR